MNLEDIIKNMPEDSVGIQWLNQCGVGFKEKKRPNKHCEVTFVTDAIDPTFAIGKSDKICAIVWLDKKAFSDTVDKLKVEK